MIKGTLHSAYFFAIKKYTKLQFMNNKKLSVKGFIFIIFNGNIIQYQ